MSRVPSGPEGARRPGTNLLGAMEHAQDLTQANELIQPWRRATIAVSAIAAVELVALAAVLIAVLGNPLSRHLRETEATASTTPHRTTTMAMPKKPTLARGQISVMVLNGGGQAGAAHATADRVSAHGYLLGQIGNAAGYSARTMIMYRPGYAAEGARLGRDLHVRLVRPLDGMRPSQLMGSHLVLIVGR
jgi:hypothetical protein